MPIIELAVAEETLEKNPVVAPGEPFVQGLYKNAAGNTEEFLPSRTSECPLCYAKLNRFGIHESKRGGVEEESHHPLLAVCPECRHIPFKHEAVKLVPESGADAPEL